MDPTILEKAKKIRLVIFDVDGILTTGKLIYDANGVSDKEFHVLDGQGMKLLQKTGVKVGIITTCRSAVTAKRMQDLNIEHVYQNQTDKLPAYLNLKEKLQLTDEQIAYIGDDLPDLPILRRVGLPVTVPHAPKIIQQHAAMITQTKGGHGAARELCDFLMHAQDTYQTIVDFYLQK